jgi:ABC-type Fe3+ transport system permease subunit
VPPPPAEISGVETPLASAQGDATTPVFDDLIDLDDGDVPLASGTWALVNLILAIAAAVLMILLWIAYFARRREDEGTNKRRQMVGRILSIAGAIAAIAVFVLTENMQLSMQMVDQYTIWMIAIFAAQLAFMLAALIRPFKREAESR